MVSEHEWLNTVLTWTGIIFCLAHSGVLSGSNLAYFCISMKELELEAAKNNLNAQKILELRQDPHFLLATILWANVAINVLLTLLSNSVLTGVGAFVFSTVFITLCGEIIPQAYFSKHAIKVAGFLIPMVRFYQFLLFPIAKGSSLVLDLWVGREQGTYLRETDLKRIISEYMRAESTDVDHIEGIGALNFLTIDDLKVTQEGEPIHHDSVIELPTEGGQLKIPKVQQSSDDPFLKRINKSGQKWVVFVDQNQEPKLILNTHKALKAAFMNLDRPWALEDFCHKPLVIRDLSKTMASVLWFLKVNDPAPNKLDHAIENDVVLIWGPEPRIITGADILGRLLKGITNKLPREFRDQF